MTKIELVNKVSDELGVSRRESAEIIDTVTKAIVEGAIEDGEASIPNIGKMYVAESKGRKGKIKTKNGKEVQYETKDKLVLKVKVSDKIKVVEG